MHYTYLFDLMIHLWCIHKYRQQPKHTNRTNIKSIAPSKGIRIPESGKFLLVESLILGFGIRNITQRIRNSTNDSNPGIQVSLTKKKKGIEGRGSSTLACLPRARPFSLSPTTSKRMLCPATQASLGFIVLSEHRIFYRESEKGLSFWVTRIEVKSCLVFSHFIHSNNLDIYNPYLACFVRFFISFLLFPVLKTYSCN